MTLLAKIALGPLLLWQARGARRHAVENRKIQRV